MLFDPLRLLRAVRLSSKLNFNIEENTKKYFMINSEKINIVSNERIRDEIIDIFALNNSSKSLILMEELNILNQVFPEIQLTNGINQGGLHDKDVYMHSLATLYFIENIISENLEIICRSLKFTFVIPNISDETVFVSASSDILKAFSKFI